MRKNTEYSFLRLSKIPKFAAGGGTGKKTLRSGFPDNNKGVATTCSVVLLQA